MREHTESHDSQAFQDADLFESIPAILRDRTALEPDAIAYSQADSRTVDGTLSDPTASLPWREVSYTHLESEVTSIAAGLAALGVERGVRVAILSNTRPEWMEAELGIMTAGGSVVTCYTSDPADRIGYVLWDSGAKIIVAENQEQLDKLLSIKAATISVPETESHPAGQQQVAIDRIITIEPVIVPAAYRESVISLTDLKTHGATHVKELTDPKHVSAAGDEATVIYTSGTTGAPKGVVATHGQHLSNVRQIVRSGIVDGIRKSFQLLPLAHGFGLQLLHVLVAHGGKAVFPRVVDPASSALTADVRKALKTDMRDGNAELIALVPKVLQGMHDKLLIEADKKGIKHSLLKLVINTYTQKFQSDLSGEEPDLKTKFLHAILESPYLGSLGPYVKSQIKENMVGKDFKYFISGGAPLSEDLYDFFSALDIPVYEGYGSTEANVPLTSNRPGKSKRGSVGTPFDTDIKLETSPEGELLVSGPNLASGYNNRPQATAAVWDEQGRLHTKDRAVIDADGFVFIKGRVDDLIVLSNGKNIEPEPIENVLRQHPLVKEALVAGHGHPALVALIIIDEEKLQEQLASSGTSTASDAREALLSGLRSELKSFVMERIEKKTEQIQDVLFIDEPTIGNGYTPTMKLQRNKLIKNYEDTIKSMYKIPSEAATSGQRKEIGDSKRSDPAHTSAGVVISNTSNTAENNLQSR